MTTSTSPTSPTTAARPNMLPGILAGLVAAATFGSSGVAARPLLEAGWTPGAIVLLRIGIPALVLLPAALWMMRGLWPILRERAGVVALFGVFGVAAAQVCYFNAVQYLSIGVALGVDLARSLEVVVGLPASDAQQVVGGRVSAVPEFRAADGEVADQR